MQDFRQLKTEKKVLEKELKKAQVVIGNLGGGNLSVVFLKKSRYNNCEFHEYLSLRFSTILV